MENLSVAARAELIGRIGDQSVLQAFEIIVSGMEKLDRFHLTPNISGQKKSLHFKTGNVSYFAFIANRSWLLWYFRRPGVNNGIFDFDELQGVFPSLEFSTRADPQKREGLLRIHNENEAMQVLTFVGSRVSRL